MKWVFAFLVSYFWVAVIYAAQWECVIKGRKMQHRSSSYVPNVEYPSLRDKPKKYSCTLVHNDEPLCSGIVLSPTFVLTPCYVCLRSDNGIYIPSDFKVQYGSYLDFDGHVNATMEILSHGVRQIFRHDNCKSHDHHPEFDIGLVQVYKRIELGPRDYAHLPLHNKVTFDTSQFLYLSNFKIHNVEATSLREATWMVLTKVIDRSICMQIIGKKYFSHFNTCAAYHHMGGFDDCHLDIGASLAFRIPSDNDEIIVGLLNYKKGCGKPRSVAGFVTVRQHIQWIRQTVSKETDGNEMVS